MCSADGSEAAIACSSTRTTMSIARRPCEPGSRSTARTRWRSPAGSGRGSCSGRSSPRSEVEATPPLELDCGSCRLCIDACPTGALDEPGTLDSTKCLSYWTQAPAPIPDEYRAELGDSVYGCDICQDVCPWNRGIEKRRGDEVAQESSSPTVSLREWLERDGREVVADFDRLYVPRNDPRWLRRNALVAAGNTGGRELVPVVERYAEDDDEMLSETARWALARMAERSVA